MEIKLLILFLFGISILNNSFNSLLTGADSKNKLNNLLEELVNSLNEGRSEEIINLKC